MATTKVQLSSTASSLRGLVPHHHRHLLYALNWVHWEDTGQEKSAAGSRGNRTWFLPLQLCAGKTVGAHSLNTHKESGPVLAPPLL